MSSVQLIKCFTYLTNYGCTCINHLCCLSPLMINITKYFKRKKVKLSIFSFIVKLFDK